MCLKTKKPVNTAFYELFFLNNIVPVGMTGFEPAASSSRTKRATGLRYIPKQDCKGTAWRQSSKYFRNVTRQLYNFQNPILTYDSRADCFLYFRFRFGLTPPASPWQVVRPG